jgi:hypothetical protein
MWILYMKFAILRNKGCIFVDSMIVLINIWSLVNYKVLNTNDGFHILPVLVV